jgi:hypothetical protein
MTFPNETIERHDVSDIQLWREHLEHVNRMRAKTLERAPAPEETGDALKHELRRALVASLLPGERKTLYDALARGAGAASAAAIVQRRYRNHEDEGFVVVSEPGLEPRSIPMGEAGIAYPEWVKGFSLAAIARDKGALVSLCAPASIEACALPDDVIDEFWVCYCAALASVMVDVESTLPWIQKFEAAVREAHIAEPDLVDRCVRPTAELVRAVAQTDPAAFRDALRNALLAHRAYFSSRERSRDRDWNGILALEANALAAIALDRGMSVDVRSDYLDDSLVRGEFHRELTEVILHYPKRSITTPKEAHWFLDLEGFPRSKRSHRLVDDGTNLVARYEAHGAPGIPKAVVDFVVLEGGTVVSESVPPRPALDAGELLLLAETFASPSDSEEDARVFQRRRASLAEAVACVGEVLRRIPASEEAVSKASIVSDRARALYQAEPGRFRRDRLTAYRDALREQLATLETRVAEDGEADARVRAGAAIEIIKAQAFPVLEAMAHLDVAALREQLAPREEDYARAFVGDAVEVARQGYHALWQAGVPMQRPAPDQTEIRCHAAPAGMLAHENELSHHFPGGYRAIANWLNPHVVWLTWRYVRAGASSGLSYDGLAWMEDHWAWFPKPFRVLRELAKGPE